MKFSCTRGDLREALQFVYKAVPAKAQTPITTGIYLSAKGSMLELQANNLSYGIRTTIPSNTEADGEVVVVGKYLVDMIAKLTGEVVTFTQEDGETTLTIQSAGTSFTLLTMNAEDFVKVTIDEDEIKNSFNIRAVALKTLIRRATFSCSRDESRPMFTGCCVDIEDRAITFAATNAHRLSIVKERIMNPINDTGEKLSLIVPASTLNTVAGLFDTSNRENVIRIDCSDKNIAFTFDNLLVKSRLIDGTYPPYMKVIPKETYTHAVVNTSAFRDVVNRIEVVANKNENHTIRFIFNEGGVDISADSPDVGQAEEHVNAQVEGPELDISFNVNYITDVLKVLETETFKLDMEKPLAPIDVREVGNDDFVYIVTPLRVRR